MKSLKEQGLSEKEVKAALKGFDSEPVEKGTYSMIVTGNPTARYSANSDITTYTVCLRFTDPQYARKNGIFHVIFDAAGLARLLIGAGLSQEEAIGASIVELEDPKSTSSAACEVQVDGQAISIEGLTVTANVGIKPESKNKDTGEIYPAKNKIISFVSAE